MDKLEKFILDNKDEFNEFRAPEQGWKGLMNRLNPKKKDLTILWKVAAVLFFASTVVLISLKTSEKALLKNQNSYASDSIENFFIEVIDTKREQYLALANESDQEELLQDLAELDSGYASLKKSYLELESEKLMEAMLENLRLRVYILNEQVEILSNAKGSSEEVYHSS